MIDEDRLTAGSVGVSPDWVILGARINPETWGAEYQQGWRFMVIGSTDMGRADLQRVMVFEMQRYGRPTTIFDQPGDRVPRTEITLTAKMGGYTMAFGATYGEALARLMATWDPDTARDGAPPELGSPRKELGA